MIGHLICWVAFEKKQIARRWDVIFHHALSFPAFLIQFPEPIYAWSVLSIAPFMELSTLFLNLQWFGKKFEKPKLKAISRRLFLFAWFVSRVPVTTYSAYWLIKNWYKIQRDMPNRVKYIVLIGPIFMISLQTVWTCLIVKKVVSKLCCNQTTKVPSEAPGKQAPPKKAAIFEARSISVI